MRLLPVEILPGLSDLQFRLIPVVEMGLHAGSFIQREAGLRIRKLPVINELLCLRLDVSPEPVVDPPEPGGENRLLARECQGLPEERIRDEPLLAGVVPQQKIRLPDRRGGRVAFQPGNGVAEFLPTFGQTQQSICATALFDRFPIGGNASCRSAFLRGGYGLFDKGILFQTNEFLLQRGTGSLDFTQFGSIERAPPFRDEIIAQDELCAQLVDTFPGFLQPVPDFEKLSTHSLLFLRGFFLEFRPD